MSLTGTSMAAPVVSGTVALMLEANPSLTPNAVKAILQFTAQVQSNQSALAQGAGMLNARGAIRLAQFFANPVGGISTMGDTIEGEWIPWSRQLIWGNYRITGGVPLPGSNAWSASVRWGALDTPQGTPVVWGARLDDNIVWSTSLDDSGNIVWSTALASDDNIVWSTALASDDNIVWSTARDENIVWSTAGDNNIVWSTAGDNNIVWSTAKVDNIVWSTTCGGLNCQQVLWGQQVNGTVCSGRHQPATTSSGALRSPTTTSSGARPVMPTTTSSGAPAATTTSSGAPGSTTTSSGAQPPTTTSSGAPLSPWNRCSGLRMRTEASIRACQRLPSRNDMNARVTIIWLPAITH